MGRKKFVLYDRSYMRTGRLSLDGSIVNKLIIGLAAIFVVQSVADLVSQSSQLIYLQALALSFESIVDKFDSSFSKPSESLLKFTQPSVSNSMRKISNIDTVSQTTQNVFGAKVILMTQELNI